MFRLDEQHTGRSCPPLALAEGRGGGRRKEEGWTEATNQLAGMGRRKEEGGVQVTESVGAAIAGRVYPPDLADVFCQLAAGAACRTQVRLINHGNNPARYEQPVFREMDRHHGLDVQDILNAAEFADQLVLF